MKAKIIDLAQKLDTGDSYEGIDRYTHTFTHTHTHTHTHIKYTYIHIYIF